ncbi:MAG: ornithine carbamoyltransferase, partial [Thermoplasmata archaeon]|nr:ornithine carbamoyltransferase [Thermoplasmata archaeon]
MMKRDVISILDLKDDIEEIINLGLEIKKKVKSGGSVNGIGERFLGMIFEKSSTGTRISF